jgi:hypothetical protein
MTLQLIRYDYLRYNYDVIIDTLQLLRYDYLRYDYDVIIDTLQLLRYTYYVTITYVTIMML